MPSNKSKIEMIDFCSLFENWYKWNKYIKILCYCPKKMPNIRTIKNLIVYFLYVTASFQNNLTQDGDGTHY